MENAPHLKQTDFSDRSLWELVGDPVFQSLLRQFSQGCITWESFLEQPLPANTSPRQIWELLNRLSCAMGVSLAVPDLEDTWYYYRRTHELTDAVMIVAKACSSDSHLYRTMTEASKRHFLFRTRVRDMIAATRLDGLSIDSENANTLLSLDRTPRTATEQLIVNTFYTAERLRELAKERFSRDLFVHLQSLLLENVDIQAIDTVDSPPLGLTLFDWPDEKCAELADRQMDYISAWANHETGDRYDHAVIRAIIINDCFRFYRPLGKISSQVGRLVAHLYALHHDLPMLGLLPFNCAKLDWCEGRISPPQVSFSRKEFVNLRRKQPRDLTSMATIAAQLQLLALSEVERDVGLYELRHNELQMTLKADSDLNARQRSILGSALKDADAEFSIRYHMVNHGIAYPTARRDFMELLEKGYLSMHTRNRTFIFTASADLLKLVSAGSSD